MQIVIDISDEVKIAFDNAESNDLKGCYYDHGGVIGNAIKNGTPLPDSVTNGDVIKALFPNATIGVLESKTEKSKIAVEWHFEGLPSYYNLFLEEWWNAPYKKGVDNASSN